MTSEPAARTLAAYATALIYEELPQHVLRLARHCLIDAVACAVHGSGLPWSRAILETASASSTSGPCRLPGALPRGLPPVPASLCLGAFAHAFELDCLRKPGAGVHPGATVALPALAVAQSVGCSGKDLLTAVVAGCEVMFRIGSATLHSPEGIGFHAPGITGPFGAATAAGRLLGLDANTLTNAYGIAGSMAAGILNFARSGEGGMVKRLHLGRAAEAGVLAALLASRGYQGPGQVLEGQFGVLDVFCDKSEPSLLLDGLGTRYEIEKLCLKRYSCHVTAQAPIQLLRELMRSHSFDGAAIERLELSVSDKVISHHAERKPGDVMLAQYSVPFSVALAAYRDPEDPASFSPSALTDKDILHLADRIGLSGGRPKGWGTVLRVTLRDGRAFVAESDGFLGCPETPFTDKDLQHKVSRLVADQKLADAVSDIFDIERVEDVSRLFG